MGLISVRSEVQLLDGPSGSNIQPRNGLKPVRGLALGVEKGRGVSIGVSVELRAESMESVIAAPVTIVEMAGGPTRLPPGRQIDPGWCPCKSAKTWHNCMHA